MKEKYLSTQVTENAYYQAQVIIFDAFPSEYVSADTKSRARRCNAVGSHYRPPALLHEYFCGARRTRRAMQPSGFRSDIVTFERTIPSLSAY